MSTPSISRMLLQVGVWQRSAASACTTAAASAPVRLWVDEDCRTKRTDGECSGMATLMTMAGPSSSRSQASSTWASYSTAQSKVHARTGTACFCGLHACTCACATTRTWARNGNCLPVVPALWAQARVTLRCACRHMACCVRHHPLPATLGNRPCTRLAPALC